jgi:hypothetical protein
VAQGEGRRAGAVLDPCFGEDVGEMPRHGLLAQDQRLRDLAVGAALRHQAQNFEFAVAQPGNTQPMRGCPTTMVCRLRYWTKHAPAKLLHAQLCTQAQPFAQPVIARGRRSCAALIPLALEQPALHERERQLWIYTGSSRLVSSQGTRPA